MTSHPSFDSTPPSEPFRQWEDDILNERENVDLVLDRAYRTGFNAGANAELEACCEWLASETPEPYINALRAARRPNPPSLKEQALALIDSNSPYLDDAAMGIIRRALEALPE